jgi:hypothetical protein
MKEVKQTNRANQMTTLTGLTYINEDTDVEALLAPFAAKKTASECVFRCHAEFMNSPIQKAFSGAYTKAQKAGHRDSECRRMAREAANNA